MPEKLKKGWRIWRFDQMATMVNDRIDNPAEADVEHYVGLEHLDPDSLTIRRWGTPSDVAATKLRFHTGDIIFGRRRVYQRKLAVAHFDGICSAHAMVLRAKPEVALPEFLPFFMQSDLFMERAKQISVGSLSPTINWKTLAQEEFALPPLEEQSQIAEALGACDSFSDSLDRIAECLRSVETATIDKFIADLQVSGIVSIPLASLCVTKPDYGVNAAATTFSENLPRFIRITDIDEDGNLISNDLVSIDLNGSDSSCRLRRGDLLFARTGNTVGKTYLATGSEGNSIFAGYLVRFTPNKERVEPSFLFAYTRSSYYRNWVRQKSRVGAQPNINAQEYGSLPIWLPFRVSDQQDVVRELNKSRTSRSKIHDRICECNRIKRQMFSDLICEGI